MLFRSGVVAEILVLKREQGRGTQQVALLVALVGSDEVTARIDQDQQLEMPLDQHGTVEGVAQDIAHRLLVVAPVQLRVIFADRPPGQRTGAVERALKARRHRPMFMVDLAVPRDIEPEVARPNG